uniref:CSON015404 protein n=1 Tax=Culicoides sonorensis TaxID=179676 RepID=A0A336K7P7_CULSO
MNFLTNACVLLTKKTSKITLRPPVAEVKKLSCNYHNYDVFHMMMAPETFPIVEFSFFRKCSIDKFNYKRYSIMQKLYRNQSKQKNFLK